MRNVNNIQVLNEEALRARQAHCKEHNLCFISLKPILSETVKTIMQHPVVGEVVIRSHFYSGPVTSA